ncbi:MAG: enoyl-CoA hydratase/isomerase family protein [Acidimicrobiia bacterium]
MDLVQVERKGPVVHVRFNRPERHNALLPEMWQEMRALGVRLRDDDTIAAVVLSGNGPSFCSGIDRQALAEGVLTPFGFTGDPADRHRTHFTERDVESAQQQASWLADADFVTIAAVRGYALGAGAQYAMACDIRLVATDAVFALPEMEIGLFPEMSAVAHLPHLVGYDRALELALTARRIDAAEAYRLGLATRLVEPDQLDAAAAELATSLAGRSPVAARHCKRAMRLGAAGDVDGSLRVARAGGVQLLSQLITDWSGRGAT